MAEMFGYGFHILLAGNQGRGRGVAQTVEENTG